MERLTKAHASACIVGSKKPPTLSAEVHLHAEEKEPEKHHELRGEMSHLEEMLARDIKQHNEILGKHWKKKVPEILARWQTQHQEIISQVKRRFKLTKLKVDNP